MTSKKGKSCLPDNRLDFSAKANPKREPISNTSNLKKGSCHRSYTLWRKGINGLSLNSQSLENGSIQRERKCGLLMHASIPIIHFLSLVFFPVFLSFLSSFFVYSFVLFFHLLFLFSKSSIPPFHCSQLPPFYTIYHCGIYHFFLPTVLGFLWVSFQDCPLACQLPSHYLSSKFIGCTTLHSQTKSFVLFLTSFCSCLTLVDKD